MIKINPSADRDVGLLPTFEDYGTPVFCKDSFLHSDGDNWQWKLAAFLDKTALQTVKHEADEGLKLTEFQIEQIDARKEQKKTQEQLRSFFNPMEEDFRVKRDNYEIFYALHQINPEN